MFKNWFNKKKMENKDILKDETALHEETAGAENQAETTATEAETDETAALKAQVEELKNKILYQQAEFENFRRRTMREKADIIATAARDTMSALLPVLDDFDRAAKNETFTEGVGLVYQKFQSALKSKGLKEMESPAGTTFDPDVHEAITEIPAPTEELKEKIIDTVEKGYFLNDKIIRYAKVVVGK